MPQAKTPGKQAQATATPAQKRPGKKKITRQRAKTLVESVVLAGADTVGEPTAELDFAPASRADSAPPRRPGRPVRAAGSAAQRETLLGIALELFAQRGVVNTTLTEIARAAGVTAAMVHYYFKSRDHLLDVLIAERLEPIRSRMIAALNGTDDPVELLVGLARQMFDGIVGTDDPVELLVGLARQMVEIGAEHSWYAPLWMREVLSEGGGLRERLQQHHGRNQQEEFIERLRQAQSQGRLNAGLEPELIVLSLFGLTLLPLAKLCAPQSTHAPQITPDMIARHAVALLVGGLVGGRP